MVGTMTYEGAQWNAGLEVLHALVQSGEEAYFVGGCVRDALLGRRASDIDITTSAAPELVMRLFPDALPTGLKHGTVTVRRAGFFFEVTTFRQEAGYSDGRRPDEVFFVRDVREDLARRDFTINAMAAGADGGIVDPLGGVTDLRASAVRAVGEPAQRFGEDALRIVRCVRFAAEFGFAVDGPTWAGVLACRDKLGLIAMERIGAELDKMCAGQDPGRAFGLLLAAELPERFKAPLPGTWLAGLRLAARETEGVSRGDRADGGSDPGEGRGLARYVPIRADADLRWAALLLAGRASKADAEDVLRRLHFASKRMKRVAAVIGLHAGLDAGSEEESLRRSWTLAVLDYGTEAAADWLRLFEDGAVREAHGIPEALRSAAPGWTAALPAARISELAIRGDELAALSGEPAGPWIAIALRELLEQVALGALANDAQSLREAFMRKRRAT
ncbi:[cytidine(C)-cytidine(C)-adenosine (A)]-adding enzyme [Cohnella sp. JJ-181]|uniref:[cytidine(C)-cytidine(C)-adenosine (A)]-adding enzyme n=1 Tax=Cohnella rhizoplanae TaxID=2974897 RepID=UPI0022FFB0C9|nr:[cytidine(C)-cytidine(C)-adenosine (A)]-adding enzyme [Cohnella sp. JJ-181]CAI6081013.1 CCA-adding enzyme [Cohnella sp. JJ-181]